MEVQGTLTRGKMASTLPVDAPAYHRKPFYFKGARLLRFDYETDADTAAQLVPDKLRLADPATAFLLINEYPWSTLGPYREAVLGVNVFHGDRPLHYISHLMLDSDTPILAGRELYGFPKKMGVIEFAQQGDVLAGVVERPKGIRICSAVFRPEQPLDPPPDGSPLQTCALRVIPSPEKDMLHSLVELIQTDMILSSVEVWTGTGSCHFPGISALDPWHNLPVKKMAAATYSVADFVLPEGKILETL